ncbi:MFS transporter [Cysteiniphilum sp. 6C5]|uniref:MFS transporter n=1 Tax=unclassified Cysteiniphilum TaxID=2610889 RepID=UPI003F85E9E0
MTYSKKLPVIAAVSGSLLEWYESSLYLYLSPILAVLFFPSKSALISLMLAFFVFMSGYFIRPIGAFVMGAMADKYGRKKVLILTLIVMTSCAVVIGCLPTAEHIGVLAAVFLMLLRLVQGFSVSSELSVSAVFLAEHATRKDKAFKASLPMGTAFLGVLIAAATVYVLSMVFTQSQMYEYGWRIPFLLSFIFGMPVLYFRIKTPESTVFANAKKEQRPALLAIKTAKIPIIKATLLTAVMAMCNYILVGYFPTYSVQFAKLPLSFSYTINFMALGLLILLFPLIGCLARKYCYVKLFRLGIVIVMLLVFPVFFLLQKNTMLSVLSAQILFAFAASFVTALLPVVLMDMFKSGIIATGSAVGYNLGQAIFGGTIPMVALWLYSKTGNAVSIAIYMAIVCVFALTASHRVKPYKLSY